MNIDLHQQTDLDELRKRIRQETNAKQRDRWRAVLLALEGKPTAEIIEKLDRCKNFVQRWAYVYRDHGLQRVRAKKQPGQPRRLAVDDQQAFLDRITDTDEILRGRDIVEILDKEFGVVYSLSGVYDLLHRLGYEPLRPRPVNPKKDPQDEQARVIAFSDLVRYRGFGSWPATRSSVPLGRTGCPSTDCMEGRSVRMR